jgi:hypothetical protein
LDAGDGFLGLDVLGGALSIESGISYILVGGPSATQACCSEVYRVSFTVCALWPHVSGPLCHVNPGVAAPFSPQFILHLIWTFGLAGRHRLVPRLRWSS